MATTLIRWRAVRNSERTALRRCGALWALIEWRGGRCLIRSLDGADMRWIAREQVTSET